MLTDFGLAKDLASDARVTRSGTALGTPCYMPPEQAEGRVRDVDERVMVYRRLAAAATPDAAMAIAADVTARFGAAPVAAANLFGIARARALAAELRIDSVAVVRGRAVLKPVDLDAEQRGRLAAGGLVYAERDRKATLPLAYGESVVSGVNGALDAILAARMDPTA